MKKINAFIFNINIYIYIEDETKERKIVLSKKKRSEQQKIGFLRLHFARTNHTTRGKFDRVRGKKRSKEAKRK